MRLRKLLIAFAICLILSVVVSAHSGGTDYDGGHFDKSAREYHYHHGYSAHSHYDMDGDGDWDCPYFFDDKTNSSESQTESHKSSNSKKNKDYSWLIAILGCFVLYGVVLLIEKIKWWINE